MFPASVYEARRRRLAELMREQRGLLLFLGNQEAP